MLTIIFLNHFTSFIVIFEDTPSFCHAMPTFHHPTCAPSCPLSQLSSNVSFRKPSQTHMEGSVSPCSESPAYCSWVQPNDLLVCQFLNDREQILLLRALAQITMNILKINLRLPLSQLLAFLMYLTSLRVICSRIMNLTTC